jgi:hypothetical protein
VQRIGVPQVSEHVMAAIEAELEDVGAAGEEGAA